MATLRESKTARWGGLAAAVLTAGFGWLLTLEVGGPLRRLSYDLPFLFQNHIPDQLVMVYIDRAVKVNLGEAPGSPLPRHYHAQLLDKLKADGARMVLYDLLFETETPDDTVLADALRRSHPVVLATAPSHGRQATLGSVQLTPLARGLTEAAAGVGLANLDLDNEDAVARSLYVGFDNYPSAGMAIAKLLGHPLSGNYDAYRRRYWLNYYCSPLNLRSVNFDQALAANGLGAGYFRDKIVVVGMRDQPTDQFRTPHHLRGEPPAPGASLHALSALNLVNGDWLVRWSRGAELAAILLVGLTLGAGLMHFRPWQAVLLAMAVTATLATCSVWAQIHWRVWWPWIIPAFAQPAAALLWSIGWQYAVESRRRRQLRRAFSAYLSPYMAERISNSEFDLSLGGKLVDGTVMFTDLEGFTAMSENLSPEEVVRILTAYFNQTTRGILEQDGTIIKYIGDAVLAAWGAPLADARHPEHAVMAACGMVAAGREKIEGRYLRTRVGLNTGEMLAGNLGSDFRFDYTLIGDTVNLAARLEGLNKYFGTDILITDATRQRLSDRFKIRRVGTFRVVGKQNAVVIHEVLGLASEFYGDAAWFEEFAHGLECFTAGNFDEADQHFVRTIELRGGRDGPSSFYRKWLAETRHADGTSTPWDGVIRIESK